MAKTDEWKDLGYTLALMFVLGLLLIFLQKPISEGFTSKDTAARCGVDMPPCSGHLKCVNGFCAATEPRAAYEKNPVPLQPQGYSVPYL
jgi:hypothetical protein